MEYAIDVADACHAVGLKTVAVSAGYVNPEPRAEFFRHIDAANIDLKGFTQDFYKHVAAGDLAPVLETLEYLVHETDVWVEITNLVITGKNDSDSEIDEMTRWIADHLGRTVPLHFSAFHPDYRMLDVPPTPPATLTRARDIARAHGLHHVYTGNVHDRDGDTTRCAECGAPVIQRDWYRIEQYRLSSDGRCPECGTAVAGVFDGPPGEWGRRRLPVRIAEFEGDT
jgi:pyruvate formate lyase activating enzyme